MTRTFWLSVRFVAVYALLLVAFATQPVQDVVARQVAWMAATILQTCSGVRISGSAAERFIVLRTPLVRRGAAVHAVGHLRNLPLFLAIILLAARNRGTRMLAVMALGSLALALFDAAVVALAGWEQLLPDAHPSGWFHVLAVLGVYHDVGGLFVAPIFVGALVALTVLGNPANSLARLPGRNDQCPCGSGLKFKRCCGA